MLIVSAPISANTEGWINDIYEYWWWLCAFPEFRLLPLCTLIVRCGCFSLCRYIVVIHDLLWKTSLRLCRHQHIIVVVSRPIRLCLNVSESQIRQNLITCLRVHVTMRKRCLRLNRTEAGAQRIVKIIQRTFVLQVIQMIQIAICLRCIADYGAALLVD